MFSHVHDVAHQLITQCPMCNAKNPIGDIEVIDEDADGFLLRVSCKECTSALLTKVRILPNGLFGTALVTDLEAAEIREFRVQGNVCIDHALQAHGMSNAQWRSFINS